MLQTTVIILAIPILLIFIIGLLLAAFLLGRPLFGLLSFFVSICIFFVGMTIDGLQWAWVLPLLLLGVVLSFRLKTLSDLV